MRFTPLKIVAYTTLICSSLSVAAVDRNNLNSAFQINYGVVESVTQEKLDSSVGSGVLMGGMLGAATSGKHGKGKHALEGAAAAGLLTAILQGSRKAYSYQVMLGNGSMVKLLSENGGITTGDCVSVEQGKTANIRRVSPVFCETPPHEALQHPRVVASAQQDATECHEAKEQALAAKTEKDVELALKKVRVFCGN